MTAKPSPNESESFPTLDPYLRWHWATRFEYLPRDRTQMPVLLRFADKETKQALVDRLSSSGSFDRRWIVRNDAQSRFLTLLYPYRAISSEKLVPEWLWRAADYAAGQPLHPSLDTVDLTKWPTLKPLSSTAAKAERPAPEVVIAVIDDGIAFAHSRFLDQAGNTRICAFWDQDTLYWLSGTYIDDAIAKHPLGSLVDEDRIYAEEGLNNYAKDEQKRVGRRLAHGTHVLDLAAAVPAGVACDDRPIIAVQLPRQITSDPSGTGLAPFMDLALKFISDRMAAFADASGRQPPLVVNISYGMTGGPQDGTHIVEEYIEDFIRAREAAGNRTEVVIAAGNVRLERGHAVLPITHTSAATVHWRVQPDDRTPSAVEIWVPKGQKVQVRVKGPKDANFGPWVKEGGEYPAPFAAAPCMLDYKAVSAASSRRPVLVRLLPTASPEPLSASMTSAAGVWEIEIQGDGSSGFCADVYVQRDDTPVGYKRVGRQSYLEDGGYSKFDSATGAIIEWDHLQPRSSPVVRLGTLNAVATSATPYVISGFRRDDEISARYSSLGAMTIGPCAAPVNARKPSSAAVSEDSRVRHGVLSAGTRSGSTTAMSGTSVAAPQITRWIADMFAAYGAIPRPALRALHALAAAPALEIPLPVRDRAVGDGLVTVPSITELKTSGVITR